MLDWIVKSSLKFRLVVLAVAAGIIVFGIARFDNISIASLPEFAPPYVEVQTEALGLSAAEVEDLVTVNLEEILTAVPWLQSIRSKSVPSLSSVMLVFERGTDLMRARQVVQERLTGAWALPNVSKPPVMLQPLSVTSRAMMVGLSSDDVSLIDMSVITRWTIKPKLLAVPGVANVAVWGRRARQLQVQVKSDTLRSNGLTLNQIVTATGDALWVSPLSYLEASTAGTGGWIETPNQRLAIQHVQPISTPKDLAQVAIAGASMRLGNVAKVVEEHPLLIGDAVIDGEPGLLLVVEKFPDADARGIVREVNAALAELSQGLPGIEIDASIYQASSFIDTSIDNISTALIIGTVCLVLLLAAFFFEWRAVLISIVAITVSLMAALLVLYLRNANLNLIVISGFLVALGVLVDDAIVNVDNLMRRMRQHRQEGTSTFTSTLILEASAAIRGPLAYATLILALAVMPIFLLRGSSGAFFEPLAVSYLLAIFASLIVALTVTPALTFALYPNRAIQSAQPLAHWLKTSYEATLRRAVGLSGPVVVAGIALLVLGLAITPFLKLSLMPSFKESDIRITLDAAPGTSLPEMHRVFARVSDELEAISGVKKVSAHIGRAETGDQVVNIDSGQIWVNLDPNADSNTILSKIKKLAEGYPGHQVTVESYLDGTLRPVLMESSEAIVVRVEGPQRAILREEAEKVKAAMAKIPGIAELRLEGDVEAPHVEVKVDLEAAGHVGLKPGDIRRAVATNFAGLEVGSLFEQQKVFNVVVWSPPEARNSTTDIIELLIDTPQGGHARLGDVASVRIAPTPVAIDREGVSRRINIRANVAGRPLHAVMSDVEDSLKQIKFPLEHHAVLESDHLERRSAWRSTLAMVLAAMIGMFLLLQACFLSWRWAGLSLLTILGSLAGSVFAILLAGGTAHLGSLFGLLAVLGITTRNGILMITELQNTERYENERLDTSTIVRAAGDRVVPIVMTALGVVLMFLPIAVAGNIAGLEIFWPMAIAIFGGLITSTLLNLFVVPALYARYGSSSEPALNLIGATE